MSTAGRINKSQTKFVPKRKNTSSSTSQRAASATPSVAGTPRVSATGGHALPSTTEEDFSLDGAGGEAGGSSSKTNNETFLVPPTPASKGPKSPAVAPKALPIPIAPGSSFGPSDPTASSQASSSQSQSQAPSSLGLSFGPRDPSSSAPTTQYSSTQDEPRPTPPASSSPRRSPAKSKGTAFGVSIHGPQSSPPRASTSATPAPAPAAAAEQTSLGNLAAAASAAASADREGSASPPHRTQREIEEQAALDRKAEKAKKKEEKAAAAAKKKEEKRLAKEAKGKGKKGKGKADQNEAVEGEEGGEEEEEEPVVSPKKKKKAKGKGKRKAVDDDDEEEEPIDELATPRDGANGAEDDEFVPSPPKKKAKRKPAASKDTAAASKPKPKTKRKKAAAGEDDSDSDGEPDAVTKRRRKALGVGRKKQTKADIEIFGRRKENGAGSDDDMEAASGDEHGSDSDDSSNSKHKSGRPHRKTVVEVEVDPSTTTMAEIATGRDTVAGRTSERGRELAKKAMEARLNRRLRAQKMKRHAARRKQGLPSDSEPEEVDEEEEAALKKATEDGTPAPQSRASATPAPRDSSPVIDQMAAVFGRTGSEPLADEEDEEDDGKKADGAGEDDEEEGDGDDNEDGDEFGGLIESQYAPQMRIVDGQLVIDESSLVVDRALDANLGHVGPREVIHEAAQDRMVNSASWGKRQATEKWTSDETEKFFDGVRQFGTDFEMIAGLFPNRTRRQIKAKWNKEDKINPAGITAALMSKKAINLEHYASVTGQDLSGPVPDDPLEAVNKRRAEEEAIERANGGPDRYLPSNVKGKRGKKEGTAGADARALAKHVEEEEEEEEETEIERFEREEREAAALDAEIAAALEEAA